ncbi:putative Longin domain-containing protein [Helianthus annuus]|nr:putative Longin domain-containing protein [Helianthus annuus]
MLIHFIIICLLLNHEAYCVVAAESAGRQVPMAFLERIMDETNKKIQWWESYTAVANNLNKEFGPKLKEQMQHCVDHPEEISKLSKWQKMSAVEERVRVSGEKVRVADEKVRGKEWDILTVDVDSYPEPKRSTLKKMQDDIMKKYQS